jgi:hypothetical protein
VFPEPTVPDASTQADAPSFPEPEPASTSSGYSAAFDSIPSDADLNTTAPSPKDLAIPAVLFGIPFPAPAHSAVPPDSRKARRRPALLLYAPPRAPYRKPPAGADGKPGKQKLLKRVERRWQEEVEDGKRVHAGDAPDASWWRKTKAPLARVRPSQSFCRHDWLTLR